MRLILSTAMIVLLSACQVTEDDANDSVSVTYNQDLAENTVADVANTAEGVAADIGNDLQKTGDKIENEVDNADVGVTVNTTNDDNQ